MLLQRRVEREPEELSYKHHRTPIDLRGHVQPDDDESDAERDDRHHAQETEIDRPNLRIAYFADPVI